ncbi:MAG: glutamine-hydrolyzing GMP synthase [Ignavibacteria bacterium]|jgi:GMP synthase (glutamine-hydrolysing)|nr:glutamine-hydrolyzing GMP synthase [Ignavibacteria bacterium]
MRTRLGNKIIILDFGSQYTQLIARKIREIGVNAKIYPYHIAQNVITGENPNGIILSGSPKSVNDAEIITPSFNVFELGVPILGICYGMQFTAKFFEGKVINDNRRREYGRTNLRLFAHSPLFAGMEDNKIVWMSHGDSIKVMPTGFELIGKSKTCSVAAIVHKKKQIYGVQFHPEVNHTEEGNILLKNFAVNICKCRTDWTTANFIKTNIDAIRKQVGTDKVICALSGGVDSTVLAVLLHKAIGDQLLCFHVDSGLMRTDESKTIYKLFKENFDMHIEVINGQEEFFKALKGVSDPEKKRKIIGKTFINLFEKEAVKRADCKWLAQGTLYPDVIESVSVNGPSQTIKSHHNVGGLPKKMKLKVLEPFRELFKDEVRSIGRELGVPEWFIKRHPFPGPGLGIRVLGAVSSEKVAVLQKADDILLDELHKYNLYDAIWQAFAVLLPVQSVGVMGDERTYDYTCAIRAVDAVDGMTAEFHRIPYDVLDAISTRICNEVRGINRVVYDITSKPPGTIEWE